MAEVKKINDNTWSFEDGGVRFFLLEGTERALMIDSGMNCPDAKQQAEAVTKLPVELLNTHADRDHVSGNGAFEKFYMSPAEEERYRKSGGTGEIIPVKEGDVIDLGGRPLEIIDTPGHTPGSIAILDVNNRVLISGDPIQDGNIFMFGEGRDMDQYVVSMEKVLAMTDRFDVLYPSHGTLPVGKEIVAQLLDGARQILAGTVTGQIIEMHGMKAYRIGFPYGGFLCPVPEDK